MIEVQSPPGTVVGYVKQEALGILNPWFSILNADGETVLRMKGPTLGCSCYSDADFLVYILIPECEIVGSMYHSVPTIPNLTIEILHIRNVNASRVTSQVRVLSQRSLIGIN